MPQVESIVRAFIIDELLQGNAPDDLDGTTYLIEEEIVDSLGILSMVCFLEERFGVTVDGEEVTIDNFASLDAICAFVNRKVESGAGDDA